MIVPAIHLPAPAGNTVLFFENINPPQDLQMQEIIDCAKPPIDLAISIINHSNPDLLTECLRSLYISIQAVSFDVWVVDNATDRLGVSEMQAEFPQVQWLFNQCRLGFSANHNQILAKVRGRYYCVLNDDVIVHKHALDELVTFMDANAEVGVIGPRLLNIDGSYQVSAFKFPTLVSSMIDICELPRALAAYRSHSLYPEKALALPIDVDWVLGACLVVRSTTLNKVGFFDDELSPVANGEDVDFCRRVKDAGWNVCYFPEATITHYGGKSTNIPSILGPDRMRVEMERVRIAYFKKHHGWLKAAAMRLMEIVALPWNICMLTQALLRGRLRGGRKYFKRRIQTHLEIVRMCLGGWHHNDFNLRRKAKDCKKPDSRV